MTANISKAGMLIMVLLTFCSTCYLAYAGTDELGYYAMRERQVFKQADLRDLTHGFVKGDEVPYFTWEGFVSRRKLYFDVHGEQIRLIRRGKITTLRFSQAPALPGGRKDSLALDDKGTDLFVKSTRNPKQSLLCVETLGFVHSQVYLVKDPFGIARLYRLSGQNASCVGIVQSSKGKLLAPVWDINIDRSPNVIIDYYAIEKNFFAKTRVRVTGDVVSSRGHEYEFDPIN